MLKICARQLHTNLTSRQTECEERYGDEPLWPDLLLSEVSQTVRVFLYKECLSNSFLLRSHRPATVEGFFQSFIDYFFTPKST